MKTEQQKTNRNITVELQLDGIFCVKKCPHFKTKAGFTDYSAIHKYFDELGYKTGMINKIY